MKSDEKTLIYLIKKKRRRLMQVNTVGFMKLLVLKKHTRIMIKLANTFMICIEKRLNTIPLYLHNLSIVIWGHIQNICLKIKIEK